MSVALKCVGRAVFTERSQSPLYRRSGVVDTKMTALTLNLWMRVLVQHVAFRRISLIKKMFQRLPNEEGT